MMPEQLERCIEAVMKEQGVTKSRATAICKASIDNDIVLSDAVPFKATIDGVTGFLTAPVVLARTGIQHYLGIELGLSGDRAIEKIGVFRPPTEVFHPNSITTYRNLVVTNNHPSELVTVDNVKDLQKGTVSEIKPTIDTLIGIITITDEKQIADIKKGKSEVSVGYSNILKEEKGTYDGEEYEFVQTEIRANHLAIVDAGRCGSACKLTLDHKEDKTMIVTIDGIEFDTEDKLLAQAIKKQQQSFDAEKKGLEEKVDEAEEEKEKEKKAKEKAEATSDAFKGDVLSDEDLNALISKRATLLSDAQKILGDKMPECTDCPIEIKSAVVDHVLPDMKLDGKSNEYINAAYDLALERVKKAKDSVDGLNFDFKKKGEKVATRDGARAKYMKDQLGMEGN